MRTHGVLGAFGVPALCGLVMISGCTGSPDEPSASPPSASVSPTPTPTAPELTARQRVQQLNALAPDSFDASYRLQGKGKRPDAKVRMRTKGERFRLDITQGRRTAVLTYAARGVVSCQVVAPKDRKDKPQGKSQRSCFLVARAPAGLPELFDPEIQRLFRSTQRALVSRRFDVTVHRDGSWRAPHGLGPSECFAIKGKDVDPGQYCYLSRPGPTIGLLARATFPSGTLEIRDVHQVRRDGIFKPPVKPTPLPQG